MGYHYIQNVTEYEWWALPLKYAFRDLLLLLCNLPEHAPVSFRGRKKEEGEFLLLHLSILYSAHFVLWPFVLAIRCTLRLCRTLSLWTHI